MKIEIEVRAFGKEEAQEAEDAFKSIEIVRMLKLSKDTTLAQLESLLTNLFTEVESGYKHPEQCLGKITIRAKKDNDEIVYLG